MKRFSVMLGVLLFAGWFGDAQAQPSMTSEHIFVTFAKTTHLIFPYPIQSVDHGSNGVMVQQRKGAGNILHVKAAKEHFAPTSLSVVTSDGGFYSFIVEYAPDVEDINYVVSGEGHTDLEKVKIAQIFLHKQNTREQIRMAVQGIYANDQIIWLKLKLINQSLLDFPLAFSKYFVRDRKRLKRRVVNERELLPNYYSGNDVVTAKEQELFISGFQGLPVKRHEQFIIQLGDDYGRTIDLKIPARLFRKARAVQ